MRTDLIQQPKARPHPGDPVSGFRFLMSDPGAIAQLGERVNGIHEVGGSIPPGSTKFINGLAI
jgi:hypothetical protein